MKLLLQMILLIVAVSFSNEKTWQQDAFGYRLRWNSDWKKSGEKQAEATILARRFDESNPGRLLGEFVGVHLTGTMETESNGMLKSPEMNPGIMELLDSATLRTKSGTKFTCVALQVNVSMEPFEAPTVFYSIYLPGKNQGCVSFKLRCSKKDFKTLKNDLIPVILGIEST